MIALVYLALAACLAADPSSDQIVARDLAPAFPEMAGIDPATRIGFAPAPGVPRIYRLAELRSLATHFDLPSFPDREICVERRVSSPDPSRILQAMHRTLPGAHIEILEYGRQPAPGGEIEFPREGLRPEAPTRPGSMWNGFVRYAGSRRFAIWARVKVAVAEQRVVAIGDLQAGHAIGAGQIMLQNREEFPAEGNFPRSVEEVAGKWPRVTIRAGSEIRSDLLAEPKEVAHGDVVQVDVFAGATHLEFAAVAESSGAVGELVSVRNPISNKHFRARVESKGHVSVGSPAKESL